MDGPLHVDLGNGRTMVGEVVDLGDIPNTTLRAVRIEWSVDGEEAGDSFTVEHRPGKTCQFRKDHSCQCGRIDVGIVGEGAGRVDRDRVGP